MAAVVATVTPSFQRHGGHGPSGSFPCPVFSVRDRGSTNHVSMSTLVSSLCHTNRCQCAKMQTASVFCTADDTRAGAPKLVVCSSKQLQQFSPLCTTHGILFYVLSLLKKFGKQWITEQALKELPPTPPILTS